MASLIFRAWSFAGQDLTNARLVDSVLRDAKFSGANLSNAILDGASFLNADLSGADLTGASLRIADFMAVDLRGTAGFSPDETTVTRNAIWPDGRMNGLELAAGTLVVRDLDQPIMVDDRFVIGSDVVLELVLDGRSWDSTVTPLTGPAAPQLGGMLHIRFDSSPNLPQVAQLSSSTYDLFNWNQPVDVTNRFDQIELPARTEWDLSRLYETGQITLISAILMAADANGDFRFDQLDLVQVLISAKYLTGQPATWSEGDWNGDGVFDQMDAVAALQTGNYLQGPYAAE